MPVWHTVPYRPTSSLYYVNYSYTRTLLGLQLNSVDSDSNSDSDHEDSDSDLDTDLVDLFQLEMSGNVFFNPIPSHFQWFTGIPIPDPRFSPVLFSFPSHSHCLLPFPFGLT